MNFIKREFLSIVEFVLTFWPGSVGSFLRRLYYKIRFNALGDKNHFGQNVEFDTPSNMVFGDHISVGSYNFFSANGGFIEVGSFVSFNRNVHVNASVGGKIKIEDFCLIGPNVVMRTANHNYEDLNTPIRKQGHLTGDIHLEKNVWIGSNVVILKNVRIGEGSIIAAGSIVTKSIPPFVIAGGIPAKVIKKRS